MEEDKNKSIFYLVLFCFVLWLFCFFCFWFLVCFFFLFSGISLVLCSHKSLNSGINFLFLIFLFFLKQILKKKSAQVVFLERLMGERLQKKMEIQKGREKQQKTQSFFKILTLIQNSGEIL